MCFRTFFDSFSHYPFLLSTLAYFCHSTASPSSTSFVTDLLSFSFGNPSAPTFVQSLPPIFIVKAFSHSTYSGDSKSNPHSSNSLTFNRTIVAMDKSTDPQNYKLNKLRASDHIRFLNYNESINQEIATVGATQYVHKDAMGATTYRPPNLQALTEASLTADSRYFRYSNLQMNLLEAQSAYDIHADVNSFNVRQQILNQLAALRYDPAVEDNRQKFFDQKVTKCRKELTEATTAVAHVFRYLFSTVDSYLSSKLQTFSSRTDPAHPPHINLIDALSFLRQEMKGNVVANREAVLSQLDKLRVANSLEELRFVVDVFMSVTTTVASSIQLYGGNGMLTNSQIHYKLLSKMDPNAPSLCMVRSRLTDQPPETTTLSQLRDLIKPEMDRVVDPMRSIGRSNVLSTSRGSVFQAYAQDPNSASIPSMASSIEAYNSDLTPVFDPQSLVDKAVEQALGAQARRPRFGANEGTDPSEWQSNFGGDMRRTASGSSTNSSTQPRLKSVCTQFLYGVCSRPPGECKYDHPARLAGSLSEGNGATANASIRRGPPPRAPPRPTSPSTSRPNSPLRGALKNTLGKRPGSPAAPSSRKIQFGQAYTTTYEEEQEENEEQQEDELYRK